MSGLDMSRNTVLIAIGMFWFLLKSVVEKSFLKSDPQHAAYLQRVRARWIPFVVETDLGARLRCKVDL